jgi:hypothetical protein
MAGPSGTVLTGPERARGKALQLVSLATGAVVRTFPAPGCRAVRDWDAEHALLTCLTGLKLLDWSTGATTTLVANNPRRSGVGFLDARIVAGRTYVAEVGEGCDVSSVARQAANGTVHEIRVPTARGNLILLGAAGKRLVVQHQPNPCSTGASTSEVTLLDPATGKEKPLLVLSSHEDFARDVLAFGEVRGQLD